MFIQEHFSVLRRLTYPDADVFIICFSIIDPYSFKRVQTKWVKELSEYCPNTPVVLVGTKYDQRNNINTKILLNKHGLQPVSSEQGEQVARKIGAKQVKILGFIFHSILVTVTSIPISPRFHLHPISSLNSCWWLRVFGYSMSVEFLCLWHLRYVGIRRVCWEIGNSQYPDIDVANEWETNIFSHISPWT